MNLKWFSNFQNSNRVATKVFLLFIIYSSLITFAFSLIQIYYQHSSQKKQILNSISKVDKHLVEGLSNAIWGFDTNQIENLTHSLFNNHHIHFIKVQFGGNKDIKFGDENIKNKIENKIPLLFKNDKSVKRIGTLILASDLDYLNQITKKNFISIFFYNGLKVIFIALILMLVVTRYVAIPLRNLSIFSRSIFENGDGEKFNFNDEFAEVADTIKLMYYDLDKNYQDIKKSDERFRDMSQFKKRIVWETNLNLNVTYVSDFIRNQSLGNYLLDIAPWKESKEQLLHKFLFLKSLQSFRDFELSFDFMGTPTFWSISAKPFFNDKGSHIGYRFVSEDVTQSKLLQEKLESQKELIRQGQKLESLGQITGGLTHDFNNLLMIIQGSLRNISKSIERGTDFNKYLKSANGAVDRGRKLTKKLLVYSRKEVLAPTVQNIDNLVNDMSDILEKCLNEKITLKTNLTFEKSNVLIDPIELENACINMAINSRDAMPDGGEITLSTSKVNISSSDNSLNAGEYIKLTFEDNGNGIPSHIVDKVFEPFFTTKEIGQGTGLGLSQLYGFIKDSNGKVELNSTINEGTRIKMYFPIYQKNEHLTVPII
jgi:nitrogen-specific signal transduction histidine kinase